MRFRTIWLYRAFFRPRTRHNITIRLIRSKLHTSSPRASKHSGSGKKTKISLFVGLKGFELLLAVSLVFSPILASAGFFSAVTGLFGATYNAKEDSLLASNSQNMALLQAATNLNPNPAKGGAEITVVDDSALLSESSLSGGNEFDGPTSDQISIYEVRNGDTLASIAKMFNVSVNTIKWANDINGPVKEGQIITILPITGIKYAVKSGDTISSIAKKYKADADEISRFNSLGVNEALIAGSTIIIPDAELEAVAPVKKPSIASSVGKVVSNLTKSGFLQRPLKGGIKTQGIHGNNAVDIAVAIGSEVYASAEGTVLIAKGDGWNGGYGGYVVIKHSNGVQTLYAHLSGVNVSAGSKVSQGQLIGRSGNSGKSTGPHLHYEVRGATNPF